MWTSQKSQETTNELLRETTLLLRELIQAVKGQPAVTPTPMKPKVPIRTYTERDVFFGPSRADLIREQASAPAPSPDPSTPIQT